MNNTPWLAILEAHSQAHEAWWFAFGLKEKRIMSTPPLEPDEPKQLPAAAPAEWRGLTEVERSQLVAYIPDDVPFVTPYFALIEKVEDMLRERNCPQCGAALAASHQPEDSAS